MTRVDRRGFGALLGGGLVVGAMPSVASAKLVSGGQSDRRLGERLFADVVRYAGLGDHRTASPGDDRTTAWLSARLRAVGYAVEQPDIALATFEPDRCSVAIGDLSIPCFPAWPVVPTSGVSGILRDAAVPGDLAGSVALVVLPYRPGAAFVVRGYGSAVVDAQARGAAAIVVVTEGPTGEIVALNAHLERYVWRVPVILAPGRDAGRLRALATGVRHATVVTTGKRRPDARATNVLAKRPALPGAPAGTIVLTTPKSGWFACAGERGAGIAIFLEIARTVIRDSRRALMVVATTGHELEGLGGEALLRDHAPRPADVALWVHIGANIASNVVDLTRGVRRTAAVNGQRGILVPANALTIARGAFADQPGYSEPVDILSDKAVGEVVIYRREGYRNLVGLVGGHPLHHTRLDVPANATSPAALAPVARGLRDFVKPLVA